MKKKCYDIFNNYNLPFETYLTEYTNDKDAVHEEIEIVWVIKGNALLTMNSKEYLLTENTVFLVYMYQTHSIKSDPDSIIVTYRLKKEYLHKNNLFFEKVKFNERVYTFEELANKYKQVPLLIVQIINLLISDERRDLMKYKVIGYYNMFVHDLYRIILKEYYLDIKHINTDDYLNRIHTIVEYTYKNFKHKISMETLASLTKISSYRLSHFIKEALGIPYRTFLQNSRFEYALKQLKETKKSVVEIAKESGFSDHKYFNQMMKEKFNTTPLKYRKSHLDNNNCSQLTTSTYDFIRELRTCISKIKEDVRFKHLFELQA